MCWGSVPSPLLSERISVGLALLMISLPSIRDRIRQMACSLPNGKVYITKQISQIDMGQFRFCILKPALIIGTF